MMTKYIKELERKYNNKEISLKEKSRLYEEYTKSDQYLIDIKNSTEKNLQTKNEISKEEKMSDRELQEQILKTLKLNLAENKSIHSWVKFFGVMYIVGIVVAVIALIGANA